MKPVNEEVADKFIEHSYEQLKVRESAAEQVDKIVTALHRRLARLVKEEDPSSSKDAERRVAKKSKELTDAAYSRIALLLEKEMRLTAAIEVANTQKVLKDTIRQAMSG